MKVKELMVSVDEYATVGADASLSDVAAVLAGSNHRDVFVINGEGNLVGVINMTDILMALEPNYKKLSRKELDTDILSSRYVADLFKNYGLWSDPLTDLCKNGVDLKAETVMYVPDEGEYINEDDDLAQGFHRYIAGVHQPVLVRSNGTIVGVLRLSDLFNEVKTRMMTCAE